MKEMGLPLGFNNVSPYEVEEGGFVAFGRRVSFLAEGVKRDSEEAHLLKTVASGGPWHSEVQGEEALLTRLKDWAKSPPK